jgi:uncharacterized DUF497 family protein
MFEWDEDKSEANLRNRGFDFAYAALVFDGPILEIDDERENYGERRIQVIGRVDDDALFVVYTWRGDVRRIISARLANRRERDVYRQTFG